MSSSTTTSTYVLYHYSPSLAGAIVTALIFASLTVAHSWKLWRHKTKYFIPFLVGGVLEMIGYAARIGSHFNEKKIILYSMQSVFILLAPALFAASIYMILGRLVRRVGLEAASIVPPRWLTRVFVTGDVFCLLLQCSGGGLLATGNASTATIGKDVIIGGLILQVIFFSVFATTAIIFHRRALALEVRQADINWQRHLWVLYSVSTLILVRSIFRIVEYAGGTDGYLMAHEIFLYIFDALLMVAVMLILLIWYVGDLQIDGRQRMWSSTDSKEIPLTSV